MRNSHINKLYKYDEIKVIVLMTIIIMYMCVGFSVQADKYLLSRISLNTISSSGRIDYMRRYLEYAENNGARISQYGVLLDSERRLYSWINDYSSDFFGVGNAHISWGKMAYTSWIADKADGELVIRSDYVVFQENEDSQIVVDLLACYSNDACEQIYSFFYDNPDYILYMDKYFLINDIAYPIVLSARKDGVNAVYFYPDIQILYSESDIKKSDDCRVIDGVAVPSDTDYIEARLLAGEKYDYFCKSSTIPSDYVLQSRGYIVNVIIDETDNLVGCQVEIVNYSKILNTVTIVGCILISLCGSFITYILCKNVSNKRDKIEYERSVTSALAHNYKSSLMIIRSYAENLISGVSEDKKAHYEQIIIDETDRMNESTEKILSLYRMNSADYHPKFDSIDASNIFRGLIDKYEGITNERNLKWKIEDENKFCVKGDDILFTLAMDNLIGNATKYALNGSEIIITTNKNVITIDNEWTPIDKFIKKPQLLFEAFVTGDENPERSNSGIGLKVTKDLFERMNIQIRAVTSQNKISFVIKKKHSLINFGRVK